VGDLGSYETGLLFSIYFYFDISIHYT
jgi:hypothetical protein